MDKGKIYKIVCNISNHIYIGSTKLSLNRRLAEHKASYKQYLKGNAYKISSHRIIEKNDFYIDLLEECDLNELFIKERYYIEHLENVVNKNIPNRNSYEYRLANIDKKKEYDRKRYITKKIEKQMAEINFDD